MRKIVLGVMCLLLAAVSFSWAEEPEIVIELSGGPRTQYPDVSVWSKNEKQLFRLFRGKDAAYVLASINTISAADKFLTAADGKRYRLLRYGQDETRYRYFLFDADEQLLGVADHLQTLLTWQKSYRLNVEIFESDFSKTFGEKAVLNNLADLANNTDYQVYQLDNSFYVFHQGKLINKYKDEAAYTAYVTDLSAQNKQFQAQQKMQQMQAAQQARQAQQATQNQATFRKALVWGGTVEDQMYLPRAVNVKPLPPLTPSEIPAGTHIR